MAAGSTQLDGFRGPEADIDPADRVPALTPDNPEPTLVAPAASIVREPPPPAANDEPTEPTVVADPRLAMARRFQERRQAELASAVNVDPLSAPVDAIVAGAPQVAPVAANDDLTPPPADNDQTYELKVNRQTFIAGREQLLAAAEITEDEAQGIPDAALVRIAQKNLAAQARLEEVKTLSQTARLTARADAAPPANEPPFQAPAPEAPPVAPPTNARELMQKIQLGDEEESERALNEFFDRRMAQQQHQQRAERLSQDVTAALDVFARQNPDIASNEVAQDFLRTLSVREAVNELRAKIPAMTEFEANHLLNNPDLATRAYNGARMQGYDVAPPSDIFDRAGQKVRAALHMQAPAAPQPTPTPAPSPRLELKRGLPTQPARSGSPTLSAQSSPPVAPQRNSSDVIAQMRKARQQD